MAGYIHNAWYAVAWSEALSGNLLRRTVLDAAILLYRTTDGSVKALRDRCPHRFAPLSRGRHDGDGIVCGYHGLAFGSDGRCTASPFSSEPPKLSVRAFPVIERHQMIWIWPGDAELADPAAVPDLSYQSDAPGRRTVRGYSRMEANYLLGIDNLLDLSHIEFVHTGTFAGNGVIFAGQHQIVEQDDRSLDSNWWMPAIPVPGWASARFPSGTAIDHWLDMNWQAPASLKLLIGMTPHGASREQGFEQPQAHVLTPETQGSTHYFWSSTRTHDLDSTEADERVRAQLSNAFDGEDKPMIEAVQQELGDEDFWAAGPFYLGIDGAGVRARRKIERLIKAEDAPAKPGISGGEARSSTDHR